MKKIFYYIFAATLLYCLTSCIKEPLATENAPVLDDGQMAIVATIGEDDVNLTKAILDGSNKSGYKTVWSEGDKIQVFVPASGTHYAFTLASGAGKSIGTFTGPQLPSGTYKATYGENLSLGTTSTLSNVQAYTFLGSANNIPIVANVSVNSQGEATSTNFKNATGLLQLNLDGGGTVKAIKITTEQYIAGKVELGSDGAITVAQDSKTSYKSIALGCGSDGIELKSESPKSFYISVPKGNYNDLKIEITGTNGFTTTKTLKDGKVLSIARAQITPVSLSILLIPTTGVINGKKWVQLWENGPKWAAWNVGANNEEETGTYYDGFYGDYAQRDWGGEWRTPFPPEFSDLEYHCDYSWDSARHLMIFRGRGAYSDNYIAMRAGGKYYPDNVPEGYNTDGFYWTAEWENQNERNIMKFWNCRVLTDHEIEDPENRMLIRAIVADEYD